MRTLAIAIPLAAVLGWGTGSGLRALTGATAAGGIVTNHRLEPWRWCSSSDNGPRYCCEHFRCTDKLPVVVGDKYAWDIGYEQKIDGGSFCFFSDCKEMDP